MGRLGSVSRILDMLYIFSTYFAYMYAIRCDIEIKLYMQLWPLVIIGIRLPQLAPTALLAQPIQ